MNHSDEQWKQLSREKKEKPKANVNGAQQAFEID
jgi:hypothetical protein